MTPEQLRALIYSSIIAVIVAALTAAVKLAIDKFGGRKTAPIDRNQKVTELADAVVDVSTAAVAGIRSQLADALADVTRARADLDSARDETRDVRADLEAARLELRETKAMMEKREEDHRSELRRLRARVAQLVKVLTDNDLEVPPPAEELDPDLDGDPRSVPA